MFMRARPKIPIAVSLLRYKEEVGQRTGVSPLARNSHATRIRDASTVCASRNVLAIGKSPFNWTSGRTKLAMPRSPQGNPAGGDGGGSFHGGGGVALWRVWKVMSVI